MQRYCFYFKYARKAVAKLLFYKIIHAHFIFGIPFVWMYLMKANYNILIVDEDISLRTLVANALKKDGYQVEKAPDGQEALARAMASHFDLIIMDTVLPESGGLDVLRALREAGRDIPVLILSSRTADEDILEAYNAGADDYMCKPFSMDILIAKVEAFRRRLQGLSEQQQTTFQLGKITFDSVRQTLGGERLTARENDLLLLLCRHWGSVVDRSYILKAVWSKDDYFASRSLSVYINHLRKLLNNNPAVEVISVHGKGYKLIDK